MYDAGTAAVQVVPSFRGLQKSIGQEFKKAGFEAGKSFGSEFEKGYKDSIGDLPTPGSDPAKARESGKKAGSGFADAFRRQVEAASKSFGDIQIGASTSEAQKEIQALQAELRALADKKIGVDLSSEAALAELERLKVKLDELGAKTPDVGVKVDSAIASAELAKLQAQVTKLGISDPSIHVDVDAGGAMAQLAALGAMSSLSASHLSGLIAAGIALAPAIVPAAAAAAAAVAAIGTAGVVAVAGIGVVALGFAGISDAVKALGDADDNAGKSAQTSARSHLQVASAIDGVTSAQRALANTQASAADGAVRAANAVKDAERTLTAAQRDARRAQLDLTQAREDAKRALQDLDTQVKEGALAQRQANLDQTAAKRDLDKVLADPSASKTQREQAQLTYDQAIQRVASLAVAQERLAADKAKADKKGIEGSKTVVAAQDKVRAASEKIGDANRKIAEAKASQDAQARQSAFAVIQAQQGVISAQRSLQQASVTAGAAGVTAMDKLNKAMKGLSPAGQEFAQFAHDRILPVFGEIRKAAQTGLLPGIKSAFEVLFPAKDDSRLKAVKGFVQSIGESLGGLAVKGAEALKSPTWQRFFGYLEKTAGPVLGQMFDVINNLGMAFANLLIAFDPTSKKVGGGLVGLTQKFADWSSTLDTNTGFQNFLSYIDKYGPKVVDFFLGLGKVIGKLIVYLAPLGGVLIDGLVALVDWLAGLTADQFAGLVYAIGAIGLAILTLVGGPVTLFVAGITLLVAGIVWAYNRFSWFKTVVDTVAKAIAAVAVWLWQKVLKPVFGFIADVITKYVVPALLWLWKNVFVPAFTAIGAVVSWAWKNVIKPVLTAIGWFVTNVVGPAFAWLYDNVIKPVFERIKLAIRIAWLVIKVIFGLISIAVRVMAAVFGWLYQHVVKPIWDKIAGAISWVWNKVIKPVFEALGGFIKKYVAPAFAKGVDAIKKAWEKIQDVAKKPVGFVIKTILEGGILKAYNALASHFPGVSEVHVPKDILAKFAEGGPVRGGTPGKDSVVSALMPDEHVWTTREVAAVGGHDQMRRMRSAALAGALPRFAAGGSVRDWLTDRFGDARKLAGNVVSGAKELITDPLGALKRIAEKLYGLMPGKDTAFGKLALSVPKSVAKGIADKLGGLVGLGGGSPDPDVSKGSSPSTAAIIALGRRSGIPFNVTSTFRPGSRSQSGRLDNHSLGMAVDMASSVSNMVKLATWFSRFTPYLKELIHSGGGGFFVKNGRRVPASFYGSEIAGHFNHVHVAASNAALANAGALRFDNGGKLPPGLNLTYNGLRKPEAVFTPGQLDGMTRGQGGGMTLRVVVDDGAVPGLVRVEVDNAFGSLADAKIYGTDG